MLVSPGNTGTLGCAISEALVIDFKAVILFII